MHEMIEAGGAPRDQGLDQGLAFRGAIRDRLARAGLVTRRRRAWSLRPLASGPVLGSGPGREIVRHYTHLAERTDGLALGADVRLEALVELLLRAPGGLAAPAPVWATAREGAADAWLWRPLPRPAEPGSRWVLRRSRPEVGFASVELTLPWLAGAVAGVNDRGVAVVLAPGRNPAIPALLAQEVLQRFGDLSSSIEWCAKRPGDGRAQLLLADASGEAAAVGFDGTGRTVRRTHDAEVVGGEDTERARRLEKELAAVAPVDPQAFGRELAARGVVEPGEGWLLVRPAERALWLGEPDGSTTRVAVEPG